MFDIILPEKEMTFKELEKEIFKNVCEMGREIMKRMLEAYDDRLLQNFFFFYKS